MNGKLITLESTEGAGKGTAKEFLHDCLSGVTGQKRKRYDGIAGPVMTREPGGTPLAEIIREVLLAPREEQMCAPTELLLIFAARQQHLTELIRPRLAEGRVVVCERFVDSTYAYQHYARGLSKSLIDALVELLKPPVPDITFLLDIDPEIGMARATARGVLDRFEQESMAFFHRARSGFLTRMAEDTTGRFRLIDASQPLANVRGQFIHHLLTDGLISQTTVSLIEEKYDVTY
jgi:dTMP kinase